MSPTFTIRFFLAVVLLDMNSKSDFIPINFLAIITEHFFFCNGDKIMAIIVSGFFVDSGDNKSNAIVQQESKSYCVNLVGVWQ